MPPYAPSVVELRRIVDDDLNRYLDSKRGDLPDAALLVDEMKRMLAAGGKRLRPAFCYWGYRAARGAHGHEIVRAAASLELLHTFALVHDDIMDGSDERRGTATVHARHGIDVAILVGDLALVLADAAFISSGWASDTITNAFVAYSRMREDVIAGQFLELRAARMLDVTEDEARRIARLKSGRYTIEEPLAIGASLANGDESLLEGMEQFGRPLGEAFQLRDDLLGTFGDRSTLGKPVDSDVREGKRHVLFAKTAAALTGRERERFMAGWGRGGSLSAAEVEELRELVERSGARAATEGLLAELVAASLSALSRLDIDEDTRAALGDLVHEATSRHT